MPKNVALKEERPYFFHDIIFALQAFWSKKGCVVLQPLDMEVGAGTFHPATFLRALGPEPWKCAYVQPSRRPTDGRYGENPNRLQHYYQFQVVLKPSPDIFQELYIQSLESALKLPKTYDLRFVEDNWESPTLGASGLGWEVWLNGMEVTQFTYFQQVGGQACRPVMGEITYGLERLALFIQQKKNVYDLLWSEGITYGDIYQQNEKEMSAYHFDEADTALLFRHFMDYESECQCLLAKKLPLPMYEQVLKMSHTFNILDARKAVSATERKRFILRIRTLANAVAKLYLEHREALGFPLCR